MAFRNGKSMEESTKKEKSQLGPVPSLNNPFLHCKRDARGHAMASWDNHRHCRRCLQVLRGAKCSKANPCDVCKEWPQEYWEKFAKADFKAEQKRKKKNAAFNAPAPVSTSRMGPVPVTGTSMATSTGSLSTVSGVTAPALTTSQGTPVDIRATPAWASVSQSVEAATVTAAPEFNEASIQALIAGMIITQIPVVVSQLKASLQGRAQFRSETQPLTVPAVLPAPTSQTVPSVSSSGDDHTRERGKKKKRRHRHKKRKKSARSCSQSVEFRTPALRSTKPNSVTGLKQHVSHKPCHCDKARGLSPLPPACWDQQPASDLRQCKTAKRLHSSDRVHPSSPVTLDCHHKPSLTLTPKSRNMIASEVRGKSAKLTRSGTRVAPGPPTPNQQNRGISSYQGTLDLTSDGSKALVLDHLSEVVLASDPVEENIIDRDIIVSPLPGQQVSVEANVNTLCSEGHERELAETEDSPPDIPVTNSGNKQLVSVPTVEPNKGPLQNKVLKLIQEHDLAAEDTGFSSQGTEQAAVATWNGDTEQSAVELEMIGYPGWLLGEMYSLWKQEKFCNLTIKTKDGTCKAHASVLAAHSPLLKTSVINFSKNVPFVLDLSWSDVSLANMKQILNFCYTGSMAAKEGNVCDILEAAKKLQLRKVVDMCSALQSKKWTPVKPASPPATGSTSHRDKNWPRDDAERVPSDASMISDHRKRTREETPTVTLTKRQCIKEETEPTGSLLMTVSSEQLVTIKQEPEDDGYHIDATMDFPQPAQCTAIKSECESADVQTDWGISTQSVAGTWLDFEADRHVGVSQPGVGSKAERQLDYETDTYYGEVSHPHVGSEADTISVGYKHVGSDADRQSDCEAHIHVGIEADKHGDCKPRTGTQADTETMRVSHKLTNYTQNTIEANVSTSCWSSSPVGGQNKMVSILSPSVSKTCHQMAATPQNSIAEQSGSRVEVAESDQYCGHSFAFQRDTVAHTATKNCDETLLGTPLESQEEPPMHTETIPTDFSTTAQQIRAVPIKSEEIPSKCSPNENLPGYYSCSLCELSVRDEDAMKTHVRQDHWLVEIESGENYEYVQPWPCHICGMIFLLNASFLSFIELDKHIQTEHSQKMYFCCKVCEKLMPNTMNFTTGVLSHLKTAHNIPESMIAKHAMYMYITKPADLDLSWTNSISCDPFRLLSQRSVKPFCCSICWENYDSERECLDHMQIHCLQRPTWATKYMTYVKSMLCYQCGKVANLTTATADNYVKHIRQEHRSNVKMTCKLCNSSMHNIANLVQHLHHVHKLDTKMTLDFCKILPTTTGNLKFFPKHFNSLGHPHIGRYCCSVCWKGFGAEINCIQHIKEEHKLGEQEDGLVLDDFVVIIFEAECEVCGITANLLPNNYNIIIKHMETEHRIFKALVCKFCHDNSQETYWRGPGIVDHFVKEHNISEHRCMDYIQYRKCRTILKCELCDWRVADSRPKMLLHKYRKHGIPVSTEDQSLLVLCDKCGWMGVTAAQLRAHQAKHADDSKSVCEECGLLFASKTSLSNHKRSAHSLGTSETATSNRKP